MTTPQKLLIPVWLFAIACLFASSQALVFTLGRWTFWLMLAAHVVESLLFLPRLRAAGGPLGPHLVRTMVFGMFYVQTLPPAAQKTA